MDALFLCFIFLLILARYRQLSESSQVDSGGDYDDRYDRYDEDYDRWAERDDRRYDDEDFWRSDFDVR